VAVLIAVIYAGNVASDMPVIIIYFACAVVYGGLID
jgi:hypothetical protein